MSTKENITIEKLEAEVLILRRQVDILREALLQTPERIDRLVSLMRQSDLRHPASDVSLVSGCMRTASSKLIQAWPETS